MKQKRNAESSNLNAKSNAERQQPYRDKQPETTLGETSETLAVAPESPRDSSKHEAIVTQLIPETGIDRQ